MRQSDIVTEADFRDDQRYTVLVELYADIHRFLSLTVCNLFDEFRRRP